MPLRRFGKKEGIRKGRKEGKKEGRKEGKKEERKEGRNGLCVYGDWIEQLLRFGCQTDEVSPEMMEGERIYVT